MIRRRGIYFGDIHFPFHHPVILAIAIYMAIKGRYSYICQVGDLYDFYSAAKFPRSQNVFTPRQEKQWSRYYAELFWQTLRKHMPEAEFYQIRGNHDVRPEKRIMEKAAEFEDDIETSQRAHYTFDSVRTIFDAREELVIDDVCVIHGYFSGASDKHARFNLKNIVCGHTHRGNVSYVRNEGHDGGAIWEANAGYLANPYSRGLGYTAQKRATNWTWGILPVDQWGPRFIPLHPSMAEHYASDPLFQEILAAFKYSGA
jgi:UDP-2,3-diacylglucosamine pyrophosphatase LpxH